MPPTRLTCPGCQATLAIADPTRTSITCPRCKTRFPRDPARKATQDRSRDRDTAGGDRPADGSLPRTVGRFQVRRRLGAGAFGTVYLTHDPQLDRLVALKVPNPGTLTTPRRVERFLREARAAANLRHPGIVPLFEAGRLDDGTYYIATAFISGGPLADAIPDGGMNPRQAAKIVRRLADALAYAHDQGIAHRDIKPANVMVDQDGEPHLMDFGLAARTDESEKLTQDGAVLGTPAYMAPEQAAGQKGEAQPASDQYSLGVLLYELLTGQTPFSGPPQVVLAQVLSEDPTPPRKLRPGLPRDLETICLKCLQKEPKKRYADCGELADDLRRWLDDEPIQARRLGPVERLTRWMARNKVVASLTLLTALTLMLGTGIATYFAVIAQAQAMRADAQADTAEQAAASARQAEQEARQAEQRLRQEVQRADAARHGLQMNLALRNWNDRDLPLFEDLLAGVSSAYQRSWETGHLRELSRRATLLKLDGRNDLPPGASLSPDGRTLVCAAPGGALAFWDFDRGKLARTLDRGYSLPKGSQCYSPDGNLLAVIREDGRTVVLLDPGTGQEKHVLPGPPVASVTRLAFSPNGVSLAVHYQDGRKGGELKMWGVRGGVERFSRPLNALNSPAVQFSADSATVLCAAQDRSLYLWDAASGDARPAPTFPKKDVNGYAFTPDGLSFVDSTPQGVTTLWSLPAGKELVPFASAVQMVVGLCFSPDGKILYGITQQRKVTAWSVETGQLLWQVAAHRRAIHTFLLSPAGDRIVTASDDGTLRVSPARPPGQEVNTVVVREQRAPSRLCFTVDGKSVLGVEAGTLKRWDVVTGAVVAELPGDATGGALCEVSPDGDVFVLGTYRSGSIQVCDAHTGKELRRLGGPRERVFGLAFSADGAVVAILGADNNDRAIRVWSVRTGQEMGQAIKPGFLCTRIALSPDGRTILGLGYNRAVHVWDATTGELKRTLTPREHLFAEGGLCFSKDGRYAVSPSGTANNPGIINVWDVETGEEIRSLTGHSNTISSFCFSPDGKTLLSCGADRLLKLWSVADGQELLTLAGHENPIAYACFSPDGQTIASIDKQALGEERRIKFWSAVPAP